MAPRSSSGIAAAGYDPATAVLRIRYVGGGTYDYRNVPADIFTAFNEAPSKGRFVNAVIKPNFPYERVEPESEPLAPQRPPPYN